MIIKVPATTANLGPGYDSQGMALKLYNFFKIEPCSFLDEKLNDNLIYKSFRYFYDENNIEAPSIFIKVKSMIPMTRGLGSSATCIVAGLMAANELSNLKLDKKAILRYATNIEGHPDNVAPAIFGGHITSIVEDEVYFYKTHIDKNFKFNVLVPNFKMQTSRAREVVKKEVRLSDAVSNIARATLISNALNSGDFNLLKGAAKDLLHEPYRKQLISDYDYIKSICSGNNAVLFISGAGPSLLVISERDNNDIDNALKNLSNTISKWRIHNVEVENDGAKIIF